MVMVEIDASQYEDLRATTTDLCVATGGGTGFVGRKFADMGTWEQLATEAGLRLPRGDAEFTTGHMERWLRKLRISVKAYCEWDGSRTLADFIDRNPDWSLRAWVGLVLEHRDFIRRLSP